MIRTPDSLLGRTLLTIAVAMLIFMLIVASAAIYLVYRPLARRHADDFAAVVVSAAHSLQSLPEALHPELKQQLMQDHGLSVAEETTAVLQTSRDLPYYPFFHEALDRRAGTELTIIEPEDSPTIWVDVPAHGRLFRLGFEKERLGINPPLVLVLAVIGGALLTLIASTLVVRRVVGPLERLSSAAKSLGRGQAPGPVPEDGPEEIAALARSFNRLSSELQQLSENRSVMIAGISHDLRTPLTRLGLAVEMLDQEADPGLIETIRRNLGQMNTLIGQFLRFSHGVEGGQPVHVDLWEIIEGIASDEMLEGAEILTLRHNPPCRYWADPVALERVLVNLLKNAVQHGKGPIDIHLRCTDEAVSVEICDRGPGIPPGEVDTVFRPFHQGESSRGSTTGGSGLGLAIARQIALKNDWKIALLPRDDGGTIARLSLPAGRRTGLCKSSSRSYRTFLAPRTP